MPPRQARGIKAIKVPFGDQTSGQKVIVLLGARYWAKDIKGCPSGAHLLKGRYVLVNRFFGIVWKPDDIGKVRRDTIFAAQSHDLMIGRFCFLCASCSV
jgi:hypothetical protein